MSNYTKATNFAAKDSLPVGDNNKKVKGTELDTEFNLIASAVGTKADTNSPTLTGTPVAPTAAVGTSTTQLATTAFVQAAVPSGVIVMWSGSVASIPSGWYLCNGSNSTPDLRNRFVVGAGSTYDPDDTGGSADAVVVTHNHGLGTLATTTSGSSHTHTLSINDNGNHRHELNNKNRIEGYDPTSGPDIYSHNGNGGAGDGDPYTEYAGTHSHTGSATTTGSTHTHGLSGEVANEGVTGTNKNLPPYYALAYIMKA